MIRAVLFDFDLTLADSSAGVIVCANDALSALGFPHAAPNLVRRTIGLTLTRSFEVLSGNTYVVVGAEDVVNHKPHPDGIHHALRALNVDRSQALYAGDHAVDAQAAAAAGVRFVAVLTGLTPLLEWERYEPVALIESVADLPAILADLESVQRPHGKQQRC